MLLLLGPRIAGEAKEKDRAETGETPTRDGLEVGGPHSVRLRYHGFKASKWETVNENLDEVDPMLPRMVAAAAVGLGVGVVMVGMAVASKRSEEVRKEVNGPSSRELSKSIEATTDVDDQTSTNGRAPCGTCRFTIVTSLAQIQFSRSKTCFHASKRNALLIMLHRYV